MFIGQDTARDALVFGIECDAPGQNIYVRGSRGTGRGLMVHQLLKKLAPESNEKRDYCYVHHFERPDHPRLITLPPGTAHDFRRKIGELAEFVQEGLPKALSGEPYESQRHAIQEETRQQVEQVSGPLEKELAENGMALVSSQNTPRPMTMIFPIVEGQPVPLDQLRGLVMQKKASDQQLKDFEAAYPEFQKKLQEVSREIAAAFTESRTQIDQIHESAAREMLSAIIDPLLVKFPGQSVKSFIDDIVNNTIEYHLKPSEEDEKVDLKEVYGVNVVLCQTDKTARPVVVECTPSMVNLLGTVEPKWGPGGLAVSDFRGIRAGALLNADQGYLVLDVKDLLIRTGCMASPDENLAYGTFGNRAAGSGLDAAICRYAT